MKLTLFLILVNLVFFIYALFQNSINDYALTPLSFAEGRYWNVITAMFMHANWFHITFNMTVLFFTGITIEKEIGKFRYLLIYITSGVLVNLSALLLSLFGTNYSIVGASAAISGLIGYGAFKFPTRWILSPIRFIPIPMPFMLTGAIYALMNVATAISGNLSIGIGGISFTVTGLSIPSMGHLLGGFIGAVFGLSGEEHKTRRILLFLFLVGFISLLPYLIRYIVGLWI